MVLSIGCVCVLSFNLLLAPFGVYPLDGRFRHLRERMARLGRGQSRDENPEILKWSLKFLRNNCEDLKCDFQGLKSF